MLKLKINYFPFNRQEKEERNRMKMEKNQEIIEQVAALRSQLTEIKQILR